jgi:hypothetical protein
VSSSPRGLFQDGGLNTEKWWSPKETVQRWLCLW